MSDMPPDAPVAHDVEHEPTRFPHIPAWYAVYFVAMCRTAHALGYALALHGSLQRDCDVVAVPWTAEAVSAEELIAAFVARHGFVLGEGGPSVKPHGRRAWSLMSGGHFYFDVSITARQ